MTDLLIRNGLIVDGSGAPARPGDLRIRNGRIVEIGEGLLPADETVIDADGAYVAPGFIDIHTHFDATVFWDALLDPTPQHGVTTALMGNCGLSLAPVQEGAREKLQDLLCYIEDLPSDVLDATVPWGWESYRDYLDVLEKRGGFALNVAGMVGHSELRTYVMGEEAWDRPANEQERAQIATALRESLDGGATAMSTSLGFDSDRTGRPVPSQVADDAEFEALAKVLADGNAFMQFIPSPTGRKMREDVHRVARLTGPKNVVSTWIGIFDDPDHPDWAGKMLDLAGGLQAQGVRTYPQVSPRTLDIHVNWNGGMSWFTLADTWHKMVQAPVSQKAAMLRDPTWRREAREEWDRVPRTMIPHKFPERLRLVSVTRPENEKWVGATLADLIADRGGHPSDVLADWMLENDLDPGLVGVGVSNADPQGVAKTLMHPASIIANSDAGAHLQMMCAIGDTTLALTRHVRERGDFTVEAAIHEMTGRIADVFGFVDRGLLRKGAWGDVIVFDLDELDWARDEFVNDLPGGAQRLRRPSGGYRYTIVAGEIVQKDGELTGARPGRVLRNGR